MTDEEMQQARRLIEARASGDLTGGAWIETVHEMAKLLLPALDEIEKLSAQLCAARGEAQRRHQEQDVLMTIAEVRERDIANYRAKLARMKVVLEAVKRWRFCESEQLELDLHAAFDAFNDRR